MKIAQEQIINIEINAFLISKPFILTIEVQENKLFNDVIDVIKVDIPKQIFSNQELSSCENVSVIFSKTLKN